uniref:Uncharacterized protein n=1 Tax=Physcomitrium patens TaxID=3218 RepID=A0A2K1IQS1_PHYPA|nr:hypothetical protein PHYPA_025747 [Physcomitrium patens]
MAFSAVKRVAVVSFVVVATMGSAVVAQSAPSPEPQSSDVSSLVPSLMAPVIGCVLALVAGKIW